MLSLHPNWGECEQAHLVELLDELYVRLYVLCVV